MPRERVPELFHENPPLTSPVARKAAVERTYASLRKLRREIPRKDDLVYFMDDEHGDLPYLVLDERPRGKVLVMSVEDGRRVFETAAENVTSVEEFTKEMDRIMEGKLWN